MRLTFLADASLPHSLRWVNYFVDRGHVCQLLSLERPASGYACDVISLPSRNHLPRFAAYSAAVKAARAHLKSFAPDLVNAHFLPNYGWMAAWLKVRPWVLTVLGSDILTVPRTSPLHAWRTRFVLQRCTAVTSDAEMLSRAVCSFGFAAEDILTVPLGIELMRFPVTTPAAADSKLQVISTRRMEPVYDVETLVRALKLLPAATRDRIHVKIAGYGSEFSKIENLSRGQDIEFLGWLSQSELDELLKGSHIYVSTSKSDSTSVSLLEAMAAGCFPIVSDIEGNREWIENGVNGLTFPTGDAASLVRCLEDAVNDLPLRQASRDANRRHIEQKASWQDNMRAVERLFEKLAGG